LVHSYDRKELLQCRKLIHTMRIARYGGECP
jgi:hypothetical protein